MADKFALVTGANKGIGLETVRQLARKGFTVALCARDPIKGETAAELLRQAGNAVQFLQMDVVDTVSVQRAATWVTNEFGKLDVLVNNAGIGLDFEIKTSQTSDELWRKTFEVNVFGVVRVTQTLLPLLRKSDAGRIVNLTSILGSLTYASDLGSPIGAGTGAGAAYAASKAALNMYTVHLARELDGSGIVVNAAHPGWVKTDMGGTNARLSLEDGARTSVALATAEHVDTGTFTHLGKTLPW